MTKDEIIQEITQFVEQAPKNVGRIQTILLGGGGWIEAESWDITDEEEAPEGL